MNWLFVCSRNRWRSPTAEALYRNEPGLNVRSAGTSPKAARTVNERDVAWADLILVMENQHRRQLRSKFGSLLEGKDVVVLDIPDDYEFMEPELLELLQDGVEPYLAQDVEKS